VNLYNRKFGTKRHTSEVWSEP